MGITIPATNRGTWRGIVATLTTVITMALSGPGIVSAALQPDGCVQPSEDGCPLSFDLPETAVLDDPSTQHLWRMFVNGTGFQVTLSLPASFRFYVYGPDGSLLGPITSDGGEATLEVDPEMPGFFSIVVDSPGGQISPEPYVIVVVRRDAPDDGSASGGPADIPSDAGSGSGQPAPSLPATLAPAAATPARAVPPAPTSVPAPAGIGSAEAHGIRITVFEVRRPYQGLVARTGQEWILLRVRIDNVSSTRIAVSSWQQSMKIVDASGASRGYNGGNSSENLRSGTMNPGDSYEGNAIFSVPLGTPAIVKMTWDLGAGQTIEVPLR